MYFIKEPNCPCRCLFYHLMQIKKRDGKSEKLSFDKVIYRLRKLCKDKNLGVLKNIDSDIVAQRVISGIYDGVTSCELDEEAARIAVGMTENTEYQQLASRIIISNLHKSTGECFSEVMETLYNNTDKSGAVMPIIADDVIGIVRENKNALNFAIDYTRDYLFDYFGYKTLERSYLLKIWDETANKMVVVERPQHMYMRVAVGIHKNDIASAIKTYELISQHYYTHASPTLFNAGTRLASLSSCFLKGSFDSIEGIYKTITDCARISKVGGGIGVHVSNIRARGSLIRGTNGVSDGIIPMLKVYNSTSVYVNQSGKRKGSFAMYLEPWHADVMEFLDLKKNQGHDDVRARDLFYAMWIPDLFMKQVEVDGDWHLMCPDECPGLPDTYGDDFETLYWRYVEEKRYKRVVKAQDVWKKIMEAQIETGVPYIGYKDAVNKKCNQKNLGTIKSSNLCLEISLYSDHQSYAVCFTGDTQILTKNGHKRIDQCDNEDVLSYFDNDINLQEKQQFVKAKLIDNGIKDIYELKCTGTAPLKVTKNHLFAVMEKRDQNYDGSKTNVFKWKKAEELEKNDKIFFPKTTILPKYDICNDILNSEKIDEQYLTVGWMLGDGWQHKSKKSNKSIYGVCFGPKELYARDRVIKQLNEWVLSSEFAKNGYNNRTTDYYTDRNGVYNWASSKINFIKMIKENFGLYEKTAHQKCIPEKIEESSPIQIASFLSGLFSADGSVYINNNNSNHTRFYITLSSASEKLLYQVQRLLKRFAIESCVVYGNVKNNTNSHGKITIENKESIINFSKYINFVLSHEKQDVLLSGIKTVKKRDIFRGYKKLISFKYLGKERVYDLNVPNTHNFITEGFVVHNCNLASIALPKYVKSDAKGKPYFDFDHLREIAEYVIGPMNKVIDNNYYPTEECRTTNFAHRPLGIGVQGLADVYCKMGYPFESEQAKALNREIFETIYYGCMQGSIADAKRDGPYDSFKGSPFSEGKFQFDLAAEFDGIDLTKVLSGRWDWEALRKELVEHGARNSMLLALMPTASTAQIMNNSECLASGTKVSMSNGLSYNIEDIAVQHQSVYGWNDNKKSIELSKHTNTLNQGVKNTLKLTFLDGKEIVCTSDHKFLTTSGWKEAKDIDYEDEIVCGIENTFDKKYDDESEFILGAGEHVFTMQDNVERQKTLAFARLLGFVLSDGCISKCDEVAFYPGNMTDAQSIIKDIHFIDGRIPKISKNTVGFKIRAPSKLRKAILSLDGITAGRRTQAGLTLPSFIENSPKAVIREFLASHFGGDGSISSFKKGVLSGMDITHNVEKNKINILQNTMEKFKKLFELFDINTNISIPYSVNNFPSQVRIRLRIPPTHLYLERIGIRYCIEKQYKLTVASSYWKMRYMSTRQREKIICSTIDTIDIKHQNQLNAVDFFEKIRCLSWFNQSGHFVSSENYELPYYVMKIINKCENGPCQVWDISVNETHSFLANGIMVHNCFEPIDSCIFKRRVLSGEYMVVNKYLVAELNRLGLWSKEMKDRIIANEGSIESIPEIPQDIKDIYKTVWQISMKSVIEQAADRGLFVDQMQSMNLFMSSPNYKKLTSMHFYAWKAHLKSGMYYLRSKASASAGKFSIDAGLEKQMRDAQLADTPLTEEEQARLLCSLENRDACEMCSS